MATNDILSEDEARAAVRLPPAPATTLQTELSAMVSGLSGMVDDLCGPVVARSVTEVVSGPYSGPILLTSTPVLSITSVTEHVGLTDTVIDTGDYELESNGHLARIFRLSAGHPYAWTVGSRNFTVIVSSGRYANTAAVGYSWKERFRSVLVAKWQFETGAWARNRGELPTDEFGSPTAFDAESAIRSVFASDLLPPGIA